MIDNDALREKAREVIRAGTLPDRPQDRLWGGPGGGGDCAICGAPLRRDQVEFELEFSRNGHGSDTYHVHFRCFAAWDAERQTLELPRQPNLSGDRP